MHNLHEVNERRRKRAKQKLMDACDYLIERNIEINLKSLVKASKCDRKTVIKFLQEFSTEETKFEDQEPSTKETAAIEKKLNLFEKIIQFIKSRIS